MSCMLVPQLILFWLSDTLGSCGNWNQLKGKLCWDLGLEMGMGNWLFTTCQLHETVCSAYVYRVQAGIDLKFQFTSLTRKQELGLTENIYL